MLGLFRGFHSNLEERENLHIQKKEKEEKKKDLKLNSSELVEG